jgi:hypothetical protein
MVTVCRLRFLGYGIRPTGTYYVLRVTVYVSRLRVTGSVYMLRFWVKGYRLRVTCYGLRIAIWRLRFSSNVFTGIRLLFTVCDLRVTV